MRSLLWFLVCALVLASCGRSVGLGGIESGEATLLSHATLSPALHEARACTKPPKVQLITVSDTPIAASIDVKTKVAMVTKLSSHEVGQKPASPRANQASKHKVPATGENGGKIYSRVNTSYNELTGFYYEDLVPLFCLILFGILIAVFLIGTIPYTQYGFWLGVNMLLVSLLPLLIFIDEALQIVDHTPAEPGDHGP